MDDTGLTGNRKALMKNAWIWNLLQSRVIYIASKKNEEERKISQNILKHSVKALFVFQKQ